MERIQLIHWNEAEARGRVRALRAAGLRVEYELDAPAALRAAKEDPPAAVVIDLSRLPSHGREIAWALRQAKRTRTIPLVFVGGDPVKVERIQGELPDATYTQWPQALRSIERALAAPLKDPIVPDQRHYSTRKPLAGKLGWKAGGKLALVAAPPDFDPGPPPEDARLVRGLRGAADLVLWFVRTQKELRAALPRWTKLAAAGTRLWVAWPKKGSSVASDLSQVVVRETPHAHGLVDFKICAIDDDWSGMCFARRKA